MEIQEWPKVEDGWEYARDIVDNRIVSSEWVRLQCAKSLAELNDHESPYFFDNIAAQNIIDFCQFTKHIKGPLAGEQVRPEPWQIFLLSQLYGWKHKDNPNKRRYRTSVVEVARKNGKSFLCSVIALYEMLRGEDGGEIYSVATRKDQAKLVWQMAADVIARMDPRLGKKFKQTVTTISCRDKLSRYQFVGRDSKTQDGYNPSLAIIDEAAAVSDRNQIEVMRSGMGARLNPLILYITTAQFTRATKYYEQRQHLQRVLKGTEHNDTIFGLIYCLEDDEDWTNEDLWIKANPNLNVSVDLDFLRETVEEAKSIPANKPEVLVKHFNIFSSSESSWIDIKYWDANKVDDIDRSGDLYIAFDLSQTRDLAAVTCLWNNGDRFSFDTKCFLPENAIKEVPSAYKSHYTQALSSEILHLTEGDIVNYREISDYIFNLVQQYRVKAIGYDPYNAAMLVDELTAARLPVFKISQGLMSLSPAAKETERLITEGQIIHTGHPFVNWQFENCYAHRDVNNNIKVRKGNDPAAKVDSMIALIMAVSMASGALTDSTKKFQLLL